MLCILHTVKPHKQSTSQADDPEKITTLEGGKRSCYIANSVLYLRSLGIISFHVKENFRFVCFSFPSSLNIEQKTSEALAIVATKFHLYFRGITSISFPTRIVSKPFPY